MAQGGTTALGAMTGVRYIDSLKDGREIARITCSFADASALSNPFRIDASPRPACATDEGSSF